MVALRLVEPLSCTAGFSLLLLVELFDFFCDLQITSFPFLVAPPATAVQLSSESELEEEETEDAVESLSAGKQKEAQLDSLAENSEDVYK